MENKLGTIYIVATPIGNISDITKRAVETLKNVDIVACEDSRQTGKLLKLLEIPKKQLISIHQHSDDKSFDEIIEELKKGKEIAYVTDGGTPGISDPGQKLIQNVSKIDGVKIIPIPGPSAVVSAISVSGMVNKEFYFAGFLPKKKGRQTQLKKISELDVPIVIYESVRRIERTLKDIENYLGKDCEVFIAREMTKMFEEYWGGNIVDVIGSLKNHKLKGELTLIVKK